MSVPTALEISTGTERDLAVVYPRMLRDFPPQELKSEQQLRQLMRRGEYKLYLARQGARDYPHSSAAKSDARLTAAQELDTAAGAIIGYALVYEPASLRMAWLDYFAIDAQFRDSGYGTRLMTALCELLKDSRTGMLLEVEPATSEDLDERTNQQRRIRFYRKLGAKQLDVAYLFPAESAAYPLLLFFLPMATLRILPKEAIQHMITAAYAYIHHDVEDRKSILRGVLESARDTPL